MCIGRESEPGCAAAGGGRQQLGAVGRMQASRTDTLPRRALQVYAPTVQPTTQLSYSPTEQPTLSLTYRPTQVWWVAGGGGVGDGL